MIEIHEKNKSKSIKLKPKNKPDTNNQNSSRIVVKEPIKLNNKSIFGKRRKRKKDYLYIIKNKKK